MSAFPDSAAIRAANPTVDDICRQIEAINAKAMKLIDDARAERDVFKAALQRMVDAHMATESDSEGRYPRPDHGCLDCTMGTVPSRLNTGLCAFHEAKRLLRIA